MNFNLRDQSFSTYGSYLAFSYPFDEKGEYHQQVCLRILHGEFKNQETYPLLLLDEAGTRLTYEAAATPAECVLSAGERQIRFCFQDSDSVHLTGNCGVQVAKTETGGYNRVVYRRDDLWELAGDTSSLMVVVKTGRAVNESVWSPQGVGAEAIRFRVLPDETGRVDFQIRRFDITYRPLPYRDYEENLRARTQEFSAFLARMPEMPEAYRQAAEFALYVNWSSVVEPEGHVKAPAMLMAKSYMNFIWSACLKPCLRPGASAPLSVLLPKRWTAHISGRTAIGGERFGRRSPTSFPKFCGSTAMRKRRGRTRRFFATTVFAPGSRRITAL